MHPCTCSYAEIHDTIARIRCMLFFDCLGIMLCRLVIVWNVWPFARFLWYNCSCNSVYPKAGDSGRDGRFFHKILPTTIFNKSPWTTLCGKLWRYMLILFVNEVQGVDFRDKNTHHNQGGICDNLKREEHHFQQCAVDGKKRRNKCHPDDNSAVHAETDESGFVVVVR